MTPTSAPSCRRGGVRLARASRGVTLVELMVGMVIGLLAVLVIAQVTTVYEARKRTITAGSDAQVNGALALQTLQRDVQTSGYGLTEGGATGCRMVGLRAGQTERFERTLAPVVITDGGDSGAADRIDVLMSNHADFALPTRVASSHLRGQNLFVIGSNTGLGHHQGDLMLAVPTPTPDPTDPARHCSLFNLSAEPVPGSNQLLHDTGPDGPWNQDLTTTVFPGVQSTDLSYGAGSVLLDLGSLVSRRYCLTGLADAQCDSPAAQAPYQLRQLSFDSRTGQTTADDLYPQIVQLQAVYGLDTSNPPDQVADVWTATSPTTAKGWQRVVAVRVAVVARSAQSEQRPPSQASGTSPWVTPTLPVWYPDGVTPQALRVDLAPPGAGDDWRHYRYKVFETVIPLRNLLWQPT